MVTAQVPCIPLSIILKGLFQFSLFLKQKINIKNLFTITNLVYTENRIPMCVHSFFKNCDFFFSNYILLIIKNNYVH